MTVAHEVEGREIGKFEIKEGRIAGFVGKKIIVSGTGLDRFRRRRGQRRLRPNQARPVEAAAAAAFEWKVSMHLEPSSGKHHVPVDGVADGCHSPIFPQ